MVTADPQGVAWSVELRSSGQVCADVRRGRALAYVFVALFVSLVAAGLLVVGSVVARSVGAGVLALMLMLLKTSVQQLLRIGSWRSPQVRVDDAGITVRHGSLVVPWSALYGAHAFTAGHNRWVALVTDPDWYDQWLSGRPWWLRAIGRRWRRRSWAALNLPPNLEIDTHAFAAWLTLEAQDRITAGAARRA